MSHPKKSFLGDVSGKESKGLTRSKTWLFIRVVRNYLPLKFKAPLERFSCEHLYKLFHSHFLWFVTVTQLSRWSIYMALACGNRDFGEKKLELYYFRSVFFCQGLPYSIFLLSRSPSMSTYHHHPATNGAVWLSDCDMEKLFCSLASKLSFLKNKALAQPAPMNF